MFRKLLGFASQPDTAIYRAWRRLGIGSFESRLEFDVFARPHYAFCVYHAARLASLLGVGSISVAEFGVAGGKGLLTLESLAAEVEEHFPVRIEVYGFDTGEGLPEPVDYRDLPYIWKSGFYKMDREALEASLERSTLVLGDVKDTVPAFFETHRPAPLGAAFFDLDFWSSTADAFQIFDGHASTRLPRVFTYCDDVISSEFGGLLNDYVGQLAAIREYNENRQTRKLTKIAGLAVTRRRPARWNEQIYVHHDFEHPQYNVYVHEDPDRQLAI